MSWREQASGARPSWAQRIPAAPRGEVPVFLGPWATNNLAAAQTDLSFRIGTGATDAATRIIVPFDGAVIGISVSSNSNVTAGSATFNVNLNGTINTEYSVVLDTSNTLQNATRIPRGRIVFTQDQFLGVVVTTSADWLPTPDVAVALWVVFAR